MSWWRMGYGTQLGTQQEMGEGSWHRLPASDTNLKSRKQEVDLILKHLTITSPFDRVSICSINAQVQRAGQKPFEK